MALYSLFIEHEGESFSTQLTAESAESAVRLFLESPVSSDLSPKLSVTHLLYVTPMEGMTNSWAACVGNEGRYVSITCFRTEASPNV
jgi:hypothetical protein